MENLMRRCLKFYHIEKRGWLFVVGLLVVTHMLCHSILPPFGNSILSLLPRDELLLSTEHALFVDTATNENKNYMGGELDSSTESIEDFKGQKDLPIKNFVDSADKSKLANRKYTLSHSEKAILSKQRLPLDQLNGHWKGEGTKHDKKGKSLASQENKFANDADMDSDEDFVEFSDLGNDAEIDSVLKRSIDTEQTLMEHIVEQSDGTSSENTTPTLEKDEIIKMVIPEIGSSLTNSSSDGAETISIPMSKSHLTVLINASSLMNSTVKKRCNMPPKSVMHIYEMNELLNSNRRSPRAMRPRWSSVRDQEVIAAKIQIENAPTAKNDGELYGPLFRNVFKFRRSYELMERTLKIYVYKEGRKPIFHQPILEGLYASEGWFMKLLVGNKHFVVKDPQLAHLFYMPFSSRMLEKTLFVRNSHNRTNLRLYMKQYSEEIAAKYRFWNRTGGADHFLVACHDWAPYETRHHMEHCIKALCNADVTAGFKIGRDISLPETYIHLARYPSKDLGGYPPSKRNILAFFAGNMHGYFRPLLLKQWKDKDPDMRIFGPMPREVAKKMNYVQHMKSSKYCICPKGYEVNSPRVVEAILYECVPVIISDNFVPPFFEILNWDSFSVIIAEKDLPNLKHILTSIPEKKYLEMQLAVRKVQRHFLWHDKPLKYDIFHMTLHSIWYNRVYQIKPR